MRPQKYKSFKDFETPDPRKCDAEACEEEGLFKAPKSPHNIHEYQYFCLPHVQEYNKKWNYFADMPMEDIEYFMQDAVTGHRPTWKREDILSGGLYTAHERLEAELERFLRGAQKRKPKQSETHKSHDTKEREALALLTLDTASDLTTLKAAYRKLVKQFHPDLHQGSKSYEEKFKQITEAYYYLKEKYKED